MTKTPEFWMFLNTIGLIALGILGYLKANRTERAVTDVKEAAVVTAKSVEDVKEAVNGPLFLALKTVAELTKWKADHTGDHVDVRAAINAAAVVENRAEGKAAIAHQPAKE